ncbi:hypothetical protein BH24BAC1_BH24BAC1_07630 [soil metagenome]
MTRLLIHPYFLLCCGLFLANQVAERTGQGLPLLSAYLDDLLCLPIVLTLTLLLMQRYVMRDMGYGLPDSYLALAVLMFSVFFEGLLPLLSPVYVRDPVDVLAYAAGALLFRQGLNRPPSPAESLPRTQPVQKIPPSRKNESGPALQAPSPLPK